MRRALHPTSTIVITILSLLLLLAPLDAEPPALQSAIRPMEDGVPDVAVTRLQEILNTALPEAERRLANEKLAEALIAGTVNGAAAPSVTVSPPRALHEASSRVAPTIRIRPTMPPSDRRIDE